MYTIIGLNHSVGDFVDRNSGQKFPYDNIKFYVVDDVQKVGIGDCPEVITVKTSICSDIYKATSIGKKVDFAYNKYGKVQSVNIVD